MKVSDNNKSRGTGPLLVVANMCRAHRMKVSDGLGFKAVAPNLPVVGACRGEHNLSLTRFEVHLSLQIWQYLWRQCGSTAQGYQTRRCGWGLQGGAKLKVANPASTFKGLKVGSPPFLPPWSKWFVFDFCHHAIDPVDLLLWRRGMTLGPCHRCHIQCCVLHHGRGSCSFMVASRDRIGRFLFMLPWRHISSVVINRGAHELFFNS